MKNYLFLLLILVLSLVLISGCGRQPLDSQDTRTNVEEKSNAEDSRILEVLASINENDMKQTGEALQSLETLGPRALSEMMKWLEGSATETEKGYVLSVIAKLGLSAASAIPKLEELETFGDGNLKRMAAYTLNEIKRFGRCGLKDLPEGTKVYAFGSYKSDKKLEDIQIGDSGHEVGEFNIVVSETSHPVVLVLAAYDPTVWRIGTVEDARLAGVLVYGYHTQAVTGLSSSVPLGINSSEQNNADCPRVNYKIQKGSPIDERLVRALTGLEVSARLSNPDSGTYFVGKVLDDQENVVYYDDIPLEKYVRKSAVPAGKKGIEHLLAEGKLRLATPADLSNLKILLEKRFPGRASIPLATPGGNPIYVVVSEMEYPAGLFGAHSESFIIPDGVPLPKGNAGHSKVFRLAELATE